MTWHPVGTVGEFPPGRGRAVDVEGVAVAVYRIGERWYALRDACPHMGASLAEGRIDGGRVVCHWHGWSFDLASGESGRRSGARAATYDVRIDGDTVLVRARPAAPTRGSDTDEGWVRWNPERHFKKSPDGDGES